MDESVDDEGRRRRNRSSSNRALTTDDLDDIWHELQALKARQTLLGSQMTERLSVQDSKIAKVEHLGERTDRMELALFGNPHDPKSQKAALIPTVVRANTYMDVACWVWRSALAAIPVGISVVIYLRG